MTDDTSATSRVLDAAVAAVQAPDDTDPQTVARIQQVAGRVLVADGLSALRASFTEQSVRALLLGPVVGLVIGLALGLFSFVQFSGRPDTDSVTTGTVREVHLDHTGRRNASRVCEIVADFTLDGRTFTATSARKVDGNCDATVGSPIEVRFSAVDPTVNDVGAINRLMGVLRGFLATVALAGTLMVLGRRWTVLRAGMRLDARGTRWLAEHPDALAANEALVARVRDWLVAQVRGIRAGTGAVHADHGPK
ncbi:hypothetical protein [Nocardioides currus]|uniref:DUF3592 domain-containing protein n=1 Tax=Nocardioides currus TaxID=2133958 RepID=A0A2R7YSF5_9ACTN|nr:hypothetical protein [Nocardioides currus]PUA79347.1 hypothetical protein C7S10_20275 [Nocardioides currus]